MENGNLPLIPAKNILSAYAETDGSLWFGYNYNMNLYKGCCHGCIYCDSRSDCYHVEHFDTVRAKANAIAILAANLACKRRSGVIGTGAMSDPYNPFEASHRLTRQALQCINQYRFGIGICTKSPLITRDIDLLQQISQHSPVLCKLTVTAAEDALSLQVEPHVAASSARFAAIKQLTDAGLFSGILMMPILPFLEDTAENVLGIVHRAADCGAKFIYPGFGVTLRSNQREYYYRQLDDRFPGLSRRYQSLYGDRYRCDSPKARLLFALFAKECDRLGILYQMPQIIAAYRQNDQQKQPTLFDLE